MARPRQPSRRPTPAQAAAPTPEVPATPGAPAPAEPLPVEPSTPGVSPTPGDPEPVESPPGEPPPAPTADTVTAKPSRGLERAAPTATTTPATETTGMPAPPAGSMEPPEDEPAAPAEVAAAAEDVDENVAAGSAAARRGPSRQRGLRAALASLPVPEPGPSFWADIDRALAEQPPLSISARPAIRPITEPPPLSQPSLSDLGTTAVLITDDSVIDDDELGLGPLPTSDEPRGRGRGSGDGTYHGPPAPLGGIDDNRASTRTVVVVAAVVVALVLIAGSALGRRGGDDPSGATPPVTTAAGAVTTTTIAKPPTTPPGVPGLDPAARLAPSGLGPLRIGASLRDLTAAGIRSTVDQPTFETSDGGCYDVRLPGAPDLILRFRSPEADEGVADAQDGELAFIGVDISRGSDRLSDTGLHLGSTEDEVRGVLPGDIEVTDHPTNAGGHVFVSEIDDGTGTGVAYGTDANRVVREIAVGYVDTITQRQGCR